MPMAKLSITVACAHYDRLQPIRDGRVEIADLKCFGGGLHEPGRIEKVTLKLPPSIEINAIAEDKTLDGMFASGQLDAMISPRAPRSFLRREPNIGLLFPDYRRAEEDY